MRIMNLFITISSLLLTGNNLLNIKKISNLDEQYQVDGGKISIGFDKSDEDILDFYTEFDTYPYLMDSKLYAWTLAEQKVIYNQFRFSDVDVSIDVNTINKNGKFDCGIYVQGNNFTNRLDGCSAYCLNLEKAAGNNSFYLKLHQFYNFAYVGAKKSISGLKLPTQNLNLRAVVKDGVLYAFVNNERTPRFSYDIGISEGYVGIRSFYSPNYFDNLTIIGKGVPYYRSDLEVMLEKAQELDLSKYTSKTATVLEEAISIAQEALVSSNQYEIDEAYAKLKKAYDEMQELRTMSQFQSVISEAKKYINDQNTYTKNSFDSLMIVLERCEKIDGEDEDEVSYWCCTLEDKIASLTPYLTKEGL